MTTQKVEEKVVYESVAPEKTVVLWVSRHPPLLAQLIQLEQKLGGIKVIQLSGIIPSAEFVIQKAKEYGARVIVPVLPLSFIARLCELAQKEGITLLYAQMECIAVLKDMQDAQRKVQEAPERRNIATYSDGTVRVFEFKGFKRIKRVVLELEDW